MNNAAFEKIMENVRNHRNIKLVTTKKGGINWYQNQTTIKQKIFSDNLLAIKI